MAFNMGRDEDDRMSYLSTTTTETVPPAPYKDEDDRMSFLTTSTETVPPALGKYEDDRISYLSRRTTETAPPAYDNLSRPPSSILSDITLTGNIGPIFGRPFPEAFNLYYTWRKFKPLSGTSKFHIGEHFDQPCNTVVLDAGWKGTTLNLHQGLDAESPIIATVSSEKTWSNNARITLPTHLDIDGNVITSQLKAHTGFKHLSYSFQVEVSSADSKSHVETFEWRMSHGKEVKELGASKWWWGIKLVRLGADSVADTPQPHAGSSNRDDREHGLSGDGKEVVAVWSMNSQWSKNKVGKFLFLGSGARGELGEAWAITAVATVLGLGAGMYSGKT